jgi:dsDNA-specific endonuclease/ATPase MutS2
MSRKRTDPPENPATDPVDSPFDEPIVLPLEDSIDLHAPIVLPLEDSIDLHAFAPRDIPSVVEEYIHECHLAGLYEVRVIHGRGKGVQRQIVRSVLEKNPLVSSFKDAAAESGGWGSTVVVIKGPD